MIWSIPMSTVTLIMTPKFLAFYELLGDTNRGRVSSRQAIRVSGINVPIQHQAPIASAVSDSNGSTAWTNNEKPHFSKGSDSTTNGKILHRKEPESA